MGLGQQVNPVKNYGKVPAAIRRNTEPPVSLRSIGLTWFDTAAFEIKQWNGAAWDLFGGGGSAYTFIGPLTNNSGNIEWNGTLELNPQINGDKPAGFNQIAYTDIKHLWSYVETDPNESNLAGIYRYSYSKLTNGNEIGFSVTNVYYPQQDALDNNQLTGMFNSFNFLLTSMRNMDANTLVSGFKNSFSITKPGTAFTPILQGFYNAFTSELNDVGDQLVYNFAHFYVKNGTVNAAAQLENVFAFYIPDYKIGNINNAYGIYQLGNEIKNSFEGEVYSYAGFKERTQIVDLSLSPGDVDVFTGIVKVVIADPVKGVLLPDPGLYEGKSITVINADAANNLFYNGGFIPLRSNGAAVGSQPNESWDLKAIDGGWQLIGVGL